MTITETAPTPVVPAPRHHIDDRLRGAVSACVDLLLRNAIETREQVTWPTWVLDGSGRPERCTAGRSPFYDGDAGIAWALRRLGPALDRPEAAGLGAHAADGLRRRPPLVSPGLLDGRAGVELSSAAPATTPSWLHGEPAEFVAVFGCCDLTSGLAGALLALTRLPASRQRLAAAVVAELWRRSEVQLWGRGWPDPTQHGDVARPLCGLAHGASGIAWALAEAAWRWPQLADSALSLAAEALRFEAAWSDPLHGGGPALRAARPVWSARRCHGAAGAGAIRLRLLELSARGLVAPWSDETVRAELEVAVQACGAEVWSEREVWHHYGFDGLGQGWTLCHGLGAPVAVLDLAATALHEPAHRALALDTAADFLDLAGDDPGSWPCGLQGADADFALCNGVAGTAVLLADLVRVTGPGPAGHDGPAVLLG